MTGTTQRNLFPLHVGCDSPCLFIPSTQFHSFSHMKWLFRIDYFLFCLLSAAQQENAGESQCNDTNTVEHFQLALQSVSADWISNFQANGRGLLRFPKRMWNICHHKCWAIWLKDHTWCFSARIRDQRMLLLVGCSLFSFRMFLSKRVERDCSFILSLPLSCSTNIADNIQKFCLLYNKLVNSIRRVLYAINVALIESKPIRLLTWPLYEKLKSLHTSLINSPLQSVQLLGNAHEKLGLVGPIDQPLVIGIATINYLSSFPVDTTTVQNYKDIIENVGLSFDSPKYVRDVIPGVEAVFLGRSVAWCQRKAFMLGHNIGNVCITGFVFFCRTTKKKTKHTLKRLK